METEVLPWHQEHWQRLALQIESGTLPHALLIAGPPMSGKQMIADALTSRLMCQEPDSPCGTCHQCHLVAAGTHPDILLLTLENSKQILIDQVRNMIDWAGQTAQQGGRKVCTINPADRLNVQSANALLKCLEEPPAGTSILLVTDQPGRLLPTIRSRCQMVNCQLPERNEAVAWLSSRNETGVDSSLLLDIAGGVPLRASQAITPEHLELRRQLAGKLRDVISGSGSSIQLVAGLARSDPAEVLDIAYNLIADAVGYKLARGAGCRNADLANDIKKIAEEVSVERQFQLLERIARAKGILGGTSNANPQMLLEWLFSDSA